MEIEEFVKQRVKEYYWQNNYNCAQATLCVLSERFNIFLDAQVIPMAQGMNGAGRYGAQCGLVEGTLMFLGILGKARELPKDETLRLCREFAKGFEEEFGSLLCSELRPEGFRPDHPPHYCEPLSVKTIRFSVEFIENHIKSKNRGD